jgi:hypothetical protein
VTSKNSLPGLINLLVSLRKGRDKEDAVLKAVSSGCCYLAQLPNYNLKQLSHLLGYLIATITITFSYFYNVLYIAWGRATSRKVASSFPEVATGIFFLTSPD